MTKNEQTKAAIMALPEGRRTDSQLYTFTGGEVSAQLRIADLKSYIADLEGERDELKAKVEAMSKDAERLDWMQSVMTPNASYDEIYLAGLRRGYEDATAFQFEKGDGKCTVSAPTLREAIDKAFNALRGEE